MFKIYRAFSKDGKSYIGFTRKLVLRRRQEHWWDARGHKTNMKFHEALRSLGEDAFDWEVLQSGITSRKEAEMQERSFIEKYSSITNGYNENKGGVGFDGTNEEAKAKVSNTLKNVYHKKPETREKHSRERGGTEVFVFKKNGDLVGKYSTQIEACEVLKLPKSKVCLALQGKRKTVNGFVLRNSFNPPKKLDVIGDRNLPIKVYKNEVFFGEWDSIRKFCKDNHMSAVTVRKIIGGEKPSDLRFEKVRM